MTVPIVVPVQAHRQDAPQAQIPYQGTQSGPIPYQGIPQTPYPGNTQIPYQGIPQAPYPGNPQVPYQGFPQMPSQGAYPGNPQTPYQSFPQTSFSGNPQAQYPGTLQAPQVLRQDNPPASAQPTVIIQTNEKKSHVGLICGLILLVLLIGFPFFASSSIGKQIGLDSMPGVSEYMVFVSSTGLINANWAKGTTWVDSQNSAKLTFVDDTTCQIVSAGNLGIPISATYSIDANQVVLKVSIFGIPESEVFSRQTANGKTVLVDSDGNTYSQQ